MGFFAKYSVLLAAVDANLAWLAVAGVIASVINAFYYLRIVYYMYFGEEGWSRSTAKAHPVLWGSWFVSAAAMVLGVVNLSA